MLLLFSLLEVGFHMRGSGRRECTQMCAHVWGASVLAWAHGGQRLTLGILLYHYLTFVTRSRWTWNSLLWLDHLSLCSLQCWGHRGTLKHHIDRCFDLFSSWILFFLKFYQVAEFPVKAVAFPSVTLRLSSFQGKVGGSDRRDFQATSFTTCSVRLSLSVLEAGKRE